MPANASRDSIGWRGLVRGKSNLRQLYDERVDAGGFAIDSVSKSGTSSYAGQVSYQLQSDNMSAGLKNGSISRYEQNRYWIEHNREVEARSIAAGQTVQPLRTWAEVAAFVDDSVWERIIGDLAPKSRAEAFAARPCKAYPSQTTQHLTAVPDPTDLR